MYYITKWALTRGIVEISDDMVEVSADRSYIYIWPNGRGHPSTKIKESDYFIRLEDAQHRAQSLLENKMSALKRKAEKLNKTVIKTIPWNSAKTN